MRGNIECDFPADFDGAVVLELLAQVLDPELDESIVDLGFVRSVRLDSGHADVELRLPTSWCAVNFAYLMAEDVRRALLSVEGVRQASIRLGDHCAAREIEAAVNNGLPFTEAFPEEGAGNLTALPAQGVFHPPGAAAARAACRRLRAGGALRSALGRGVDRG
jgi:metal-sulfur cluster biosynthetic enzyme